MFQNAESFANGRCCGYFSLALIQNEFQHIESLRIVVHYKHVQAIEFLRMGGPAMLERRFVLWLEGPETLQAFQRRLAASRAFSPRMLTNVPVNAKTRSLSVFEKSFVLDNRTSTRNEKNVAK